MKPQYSYSWYFEQYKQAKDTAEKFILSVDEALFTQPPAEGRWSIAECYSHLIKYDNLYFGNIRQGITNNPPTTDDLDQPFEPSWLARKVISFFEPPYKMKLKTVKVLKPKPVSGFNRMELLDEYINLQDRLIAQLEEAQHTHVDLGTTKVKHPLVGFIKMSLSACFAIIEVHQRRHQWQAKQTLKALESAHS